MGVATAVGKSSLFQCSITCKSIGPGVVPNVLVGTIIVIDEGGEVSGQARVQGRLNSGIHTSCWKCPSIPSTRGPSVAEVKAWGEEGLSHLIECLIAVETEQACSEFIDIVAGAPVDIPTIDIQCDARDQGSSEVPGRGREGQARWGHLDRVLGGQHQLH